MSIAEANAQLTAAGQLFEMEELDIRGVPTRTWKHAPPSLRAIMDMSLGHGDAVFLVYEDERTTFAEHYRIACTLAHRLRDTFGIAAGRPRGHHHAQPAGVGHGLLGRHAGRCHRRPAERVVERRGTALRPGGLGLQGGLRRHGAGGTDPPRPGRTARPRRRHCGRRAPHRDRRAARPCPSRPPGRGSCPNGRSPWRWAPSTKRPRRPTSPSTPRTTPPSSTRRAPPAVPRVPSAPTATWGRT